MGTMTVIDGGHAPNGPAQMLLDRLERVQKYGKGWRAKCPAHSGKGGNSLSVAIGDDGRVLIHCFGGCDVKEVLDAVHLEVADLFPQRLTHNATPEERRAIRQQAKQAQWAAALDVLEFEARVVMIAVGDMVQKGGDIFDREDLDRLKLAQERIEGAWKVFRGR